MHHFATLWIHHLHRVMTHFSD